MKKTALVFAFISLSLGIVLLLFYIVIVCKHWQICDYSWNFITSNVTEQLTKNIGDFIWGTIGITFTFTATIFLFITFHEQREQLKVTKEQSDKARFETTYFNILGMLKQVQDTVNTNIASRHIDGNVSNLIEYYTCFRNTYRDHLVTDTNLADFESSFFPLDANQATIEQLQGLLAAEYENYITSTDCNVGYMYRYIFNTIKFVTDDPYNKKDIKSRDRYLNLLQAQLSNEELCLIFYNAISKYGKNKEGQYYFKELLDATHFLENIDSSFLLDRKHYKLYPHTIFKFLNRNEIACVTPSV